MANAGDFSAAVSVDIPAQSLASALTTFATQADLQILVSQDLVEGLRAPALAGNYSAAQAFERILGGSNLEFVMSGRDTVVIRARDSSRARKSAVLR